MYSIILTPGSNNIDEIINSINHDCITFYLTPGKYYITNPISIKNKKYINLLGKNDINDVVNQIEIIQIIPHTNTVQIENCEYITLRNITLIASQGRSISLCISNSNNNEINNCRFINTNPYFCVYYSGPELNIGKHTMKEYKNNNLDKNNIFCHNIIHSNWEGDCVTFALQKNGRIFDNIIKRGKIALYMITDCLINYNYIFDSLSHGIICSLPSKNVNISYNYIRNTKSAGINVMMQLEHGNFSAFDYNIIIKNNNIVDSKYIGIEVSNGISIDINNNKIVNPSCSGIYLLKSSKCNVLKNHIENYEVGIFMDIECRENNIIDNILIREDLLLKKILFNVILEKETQNNIVNGNQMIKKDDTDKSIIIYNLGTNIIT